MAIFGFFYKGQQVHPGWYCCNKLNKRIDVITKVGASIIQIDSGLKHPFTMSHEKLYDLIRRGIVELYKFPPKNVRINPNQEFKRKVKYGF